jgi:hypothetical protein
MAARSQPQWTALIQEQEQTMLRLTAGLQQWVEGLQPSPGPSDKRIITIVHGEIRNKRIAIHRGRRIHSTTGTTVPRDVQGQTHFSGTIQARHPARPEAAVRLIAVGLQEAVHLQVQDQMADPGVEIN